MIYGLNIYVLEMFLKIHNKRNAWPCKQSWFVILCQAQENVKENNTDTWKLPSWKQKTSLLQKAYMLVKDGNRIENYLHSTGQFYDEPHIDIRLHCKDYHT